MNAASLLIFDNQASGHRANYVALFARITGGIPLITSFADAWERVLLSPKLILPTFEGAPRRNLLLILCRMLLRRKTAVVLLRAHLFHHRSNMSRRMHGAMLRIFGRSRVILPLSIVDSCDLTKRCPGIEVIVDPEFWDFEFLTPAASDPNLEAQLRGAASRRKIILIAGALSPDKAIDQLERLFAAHPDHMANYFPVAAGKILPGLGDAPEFISRRGLLIDRHLNEAEFNALFAVADFAWCAYRPERDMSSGILGRCIQTGVIPIVRQGSVAARIVRRWTCPVDIDFDDPVRSAAQLASADARRTAVPHGRLKAEGDRVSHTLGAFFELKGTPNPCAE